MNSFSSISPNSLTIFLNVSASKKCWRLGCGRNLLCYRSQNRLRPSEGFKRLFILTGASLKTYEKPVIV